MSEIEVKVDIGIDCVVCGIQLEVKSFGSPSPFFAVTPCPECTKVARDEEYEKGYQAGLKAL